MGKVLVKNREIVIPGEVVAEGMDFLPTKGIFRENEKLIASQIGSINVDGRLVKLIPLTGSYSPKKNDFVIGKVLNIGFSGWTIDIGHSNLAMMNLKDASNDYIERGADLRQYYDYGDMVVAKISNVTSSNLIDLTMKGPGLMKLNGGIIIDINSSKVPRVIGKQGSMISLIKNKTNCRVTVGQNGKVWIKGDDPKMEKNISNMVIQEEPMIVEEQEKQNLGENSFVCIPCTHHQQGYCNPVSCASCDIYKREMEERYARGNPADN